MTTQPARNAAISKELTMNGITTTATRTGTDRVNGLDLYYEVHGDGPPLVLLQGALGTIDTCFGGLLPSLAQARTVIAVELQGTDTPLTPTAPSAIRSWPTTSPTLWRHSASRSLTWSATAWVARSPTARARQSRDGPAARLIRLAASRPGVKARDRDYELEQVKARTRGCPRRSRRWRCA